jgi:hypothetical protein
MLNVYLIRVHLPRAASNYVADVVVARGEHNRSAFGLESNSISST